jgi:radical SAM-linked protein
VAAATALPVGIPGEGELAEMVLTERLTRVDVRSRLEGRLATGHRLVDLFDVWLGDPSLAASLAAADYRLEVEGVSAVELAEACRALLDSTTLERSRAKGEGRSVTYDLRPLLLGLEVLPGTAKLVGADGMAVVRMRLRHRQEGGIGRPDEVILALAERLGGEVAVLSTIRERLLTSDELPPV